MNRAIWVLSWPVLVESFLNSLVGFTDTYLAAQLGEAQTDAIGGASYINWFIGLIIMAIGVGATALIARSVGAGRLAVANAALGQSLTLSVIAGTVVGVFVILLARPVATMLNLAPAAADAFTVYTSVLAAGIPLTGLLFAGIACARGAGDSLRPLLAMVAVNVVNVVASWLLSGVDLVAMRSVAGELRAVVLVHNPSPFNMGVLGIAIGTLAGHAVGAAIILRMAFKGVWGIRLIGRRIRPHWHTMRRLVRIGLPNLVETLGMWVGNFFIILLVGRIGASGFLGAHIIAIRVESLSFMPGFAMGAAAATLAGQYLGAQSPRHARAGVWRCTLVAATTMGISGVLLALFPRAIVGVLSSQQSHLDLAPPLLIVAGLIQAPFAVSIVFRSAIRGAGDVRFAMAVTWATTYFLRLPLAYLLSGVDLAFTIPGAGGAARRIVIENPSPVQWGLTGLWIGLCLEIIVRAAIFTARFLQGGWLTKKV